MMFKWFLIGCAVGAIISPAAAGVVNQLTGKNTQQWGFIAGKYTRENILKFPPLDYGEEQNQ